LILKLSSAKELSEVSGKAFDKECEYNDLLNRKIIEAAVEGRYSNNLYLGELIRVIDKTKKHLDSDINSNTTDLNSKELIDLAKKVLQNLNEKLNESGYEASLSGNCLKFSWSTNGQSQ